MNIISIIYLIGNLIQDVNNPSTFTVTFFLNYFGNIILFIPFYYVLFVYILYLFILLYIKIDKV